MDRRSFISLHTPINPKIFGAFFSFWYATRPIIKVWRWICMLMETRLQSMLSSVLRWWAHADILTRLATLPTKIKPLYADFEIDDDFVQCISPGHGWYKCHLSMHISLLYSFLWPATARCSQLAHILEHEMWLARRGELKNRLGREGKMHMCCFHSTRMYPNRTDMMQIGNDYERINKKSDTKCGHYMDRLKCW